MRTFSEINSSADVFDSSVLLKQCDVCVIHHLTLVEFLNFKPESGGADPQIYHIRTERCCNRENPLFTYVSLIHICSSQCTDASSISFLEYGKLKLQLQVVLGPNALGQARLDSLSSDNQKPNKQTCC